MRGLQQTFTYMGLRTQSRLDHCSSVDSGCAVLGIRHTHKESQTHTHLSTFCGFKIGVKCDTLIRSLGHSLAGEGLYGL